jgi:tetratricopeptide (TPR) repeat protein
MNWAFPRTWEGFKHAISRGQYERIVATPIFSREFLNQIGTYFQDLRITFTLPIAILGFLPFTAWRIKLGEARFRAVYVSTLMAATAVLLIALEEFLAPATGEILALTMVYRGVIASILVLLCIGGGVMIVAEVWDFFARLFTDRPDSPLELHEDDTVSTDMDGISRKWIVVTLSGFLVMSLILIMLASPKGDIQDAFIQRVKFISSHALFALWIGYGLIVALGALGAMLGGNRVLIYAATAVAALLWIEPIRQNAFNRELVRVYGGAEQGANNDFGWQFGNYQLRGADAFHEELSPDEEPLPNPCFPPEMGTNAIFFGGTDPGRFVPTYMIYGARVREDVYLITQNALADNTYMNVMRDLYGDQIWIPAQKDSARAFQRYVEEVNSGKRPRNAQLTIENGRVQVSGALGVMEINGILAEMIFEHNSFRHDFYVEESYVIPWMYPYLTPHGLIMKINARHTPLTPQMNRDDTDLWDWYCRRFSDNPLFRRDVVARKSFSKLRSAIAGLYRSRGDFERAEAAFQQARILYPLSPEANFRLVQEVLMAFRRFGESREIMGDFAAQDPGNTKVFEFLDQLDQLDQLHKRVEEIEKEMSKGMQLDANKAVELATLYLQVGQIPKFNAMAASILNNKDLPSMYHYQVAQLYSRNKDMANMVKALDLCLPHIPTNAPSNLLLDIAQLYAKARRLDRMLESMLVYVKRKPDDWRAWLDVAAMQVGMKRNDEANKALDQAVRYGGSEALDMIMEDSRFESFRKKLAPPNPAVFGLDGRSGLRAPFGTP